MTPPLDSVFVAQLAEESLLGSFNRAGVLAPADVHVARRLARLGGDEDELLVLAVAFAVRAPRVGHVRVDLASVRETAEGELEQEVDLDALPWPDPQAWLAGVSRSPLVAVGDGDAKVAPLRLVGSALYLDRYWRDERAVATDLLARSVAIGSEGAAFERDLTGAMGRLFTTVGSATTTTTTTTADDDDDAAAADPEQRWAAAVAVRRRLAVVAGGPGTGKTTTVARLIGLLGVQAEATGSELPLVALVAPTGKAANRMQEAVRAAAETLDVSEAVREHLLGLEAATVHRLLRPRPDNSSRFRHNRRNRLPHDIVVVDETSMLPLWLMARLLEAVRSDARLVLVGDPEQLASVEAGAVLGDVVGPASERLRMHASAAANLASVTGVSLDVETLPDDAPGTGDGVVVLRTNHRFRGGLAALAEAIRSGDGDSTVAALGGGDKDLGWLPLDATETNEEELEAVRQMACESALAMIDAARAAEWEKALEALAASRILCAHRRGPAGVSTWNARVERWLVDEVEGFSAEGEWYVGRPVIVTANDYSLRLFNGDSGVVVAREPAGSAAAGTRAAGARAAGVAAAFERGLVSPSRLYDVDTVYAMTVHKSQGSEFDKVAVVLPQPTSRVLTRELLYTAVTRARRQLLVVGTEESVRAAVERPIARASGLTGRLWGERWS